MWKKGGWTVLFIILPLSGAEAADLSGSNIAWRANFRRVALEVSNTSVSNASEYKDSPNAKLSADGESQIKGIFDFVLERESAGSKWDNSLFMEYGETRVKPAEGDPTKTENADKILLKTDYTEKIWKYEEADVGPFGSLGYQTEFTANEDAPRTKTFRGMAGIKLFNGTYLKELYAAAVQEVDLTYAQSIDKSAYEVGLRAEYPLREGVKFQLEGYWRDYIYFSRYQATDFNYEFNLIARMDVKITDIASIAPYVNYFQAKARGAEKEGSNFLIGLSLVYADIFNL